MSNVTRQPLAKTPPCEFVRSLFRDRLNQFAVEAKRNLLPLGLSALAALTASQTGCSSSLRGIGRELTDNALIEYRDAVWSRRAYNLRYGNCDRPFSNHYRDGFCAGYQDICNGGDGYVPALPPTEYRGYEYQSAEGAKCVNTWFEGYPAGVAAAKQDRSGEFKDMFISRMINSAVTQDNAKHMLPGDVPIVKSEAPDNQSGTTDAQAPPAPASLDQSFSSVNYAAPSVLTASNSGTDAEFAAELKLDGPQLTGTPLSELGQVQLGTSQQPDMSNGQAVRPALPPIVKAPAAANQTLPAMPYASGAAAHTANALPSDNNRFVR